MRIQKLGQIQVQGVLSIGFPSYPHYTMCILGSMLPAYDFIVMIFLGKGHKIIRKNPV